MNFIITTIVMLTFWILLSGEFTIILLTSAVSASLLVAFMSSDLFMGKGVDLGLGFRRLIRFIQYIPWLLWQIIKANVDVAFHALNPKISIDPCLIKFKADLKTELGITCLSNSITLTPGTVTLSANSKGEYIVHALTRKHADDLLAGEMQSRVKWIEDA